MNLPCTIKINIFNIILYTFAIIGIRQRRRFFNSLVFCIYGIRSPLPSQSFLYTHIYSILYSLTCAATMALRRLAMLRSAEGSNGCSPLVLVRWTYSIAKPSPLDSVLSNTVVSPQFVLPESDRSSDTNGFGFPCLPFGGGSMELMAVPRKKVFLLSISSLFIFFFFFSLGLTKDQTFTFT